MASALTELLGARLKGDGDTETATALEGKTAVALYFADGSEASKEFTATFSKAYDGGLSDKGLEVILVASCETEEEADGVFTDMPWLMLPFDSTTERQALVEKFEASTAPKLVILDAEAQLITDDGMAKVTEDPQGENFPWATPVLTEQDILIKLGSVPPEAGESGIKGIFINSKNYIPLGLVDQQEEDDDIPFSGMKLKPYVEKKKQEALDEVKKMGFASDFHPQHKEIEKFPGDSLLLMFDPEKAYGEKIVWCTTVEAYNREKERIQSLRDEIVAEFEKSLRPASAGGGGGGGEEAEEEQEENIVVRDAPKDCGEWKSETMEATHKEVLNFTVQNSRPKMQLMIMRPRSQFGKPFKFSDSGENINGARPQKDPNFALQRKELEMGIQAVKEMRTISCQTTWYRPVNKSTQYSPNDFLPKQTEAGYDKVDELTEFLSAVSVGVEEALQTNETVDIFQEEFAHLGEAEAGASSDANSGIKDLRTFQDVNLTRGKRIECVEWVPGSMDMLACSCCESLSFTERLDNAGKATESTILIWSFQDPLAPHAILKSPWEVPVFKFYPSDEKFVVAGLSSGQVAVWKLSDADLGHAMREKGKGAQEDERSSATPTVPHKQISFIDESHKKPVLAIEWLPAHIEIEKRGRGAKESATKDGPVKYFVTIAGDGQVLLWNFQEVLDSINDADFSWQPLHRVQLQRQDSGTEMGCCHLLYCHDRLDDKGKPAMTNFYASTEEGELILGDWAARAEEDRKAEFVKKLFPISKTFRPMLSLERSPFFPDILLGVTDWAFFLWKDGVKEHLFQSSYTSTYFTRGVWSPTRPSVIFLGLQSGMIDIWDFSDQSHKAALSDQGASVPIASMVFRKTGDRDAVGEQLLAVGDSQGTLHVLHVPKNLVRQAGKSEKDIMGRFLEREEARVKYFEDRRHKLGDLKEQMEKDEQMALDKEAAEKEKATADQDVADKAADAVYQKLLVEVQEQLRG